MHEVLVIGGGPAGLTAAMYCRMRKMSVVVIDAGRVGGQLVSLYGDKPVHDWPGYHHIIAGELAGHLIHHAEQLGVETVANTKITGLARDPEGCWIAEGTEQVSREPRAYRANAVIIAIGGGAFEPRKLRCPGEDELDEDQLTYRMPDTSRVAGKRVVVVGGGDSGLESAQSAREAGAEVTIVQLLERFSGMEHNIDRVAELGIPAIFNTRVRALELSNGRLVAVVAQTKGSTDTTRIDADMVVVNIGASVNLDAVRRWGVAVEGNLIPVDASLRTNLEGVFACGDICTHEGKVKLLLTASSEGCLAANAAYMHVRKPARLTMGELYT